MITGIINGLLIILSLFIFYLLVSLGLGVYMARAFSFGNSKAMDFTYKKCLENNDFTDEEFKSYKFTNFSVESPFGYTLKGVYSSGQNPEKTVIFVHGHRWSWHGMVKYMALYKDRGYNLLAYNHRYHGDSGGKNCTGGFYEKQDLAAIINQAKKIFPDTRILGTMGESLGAATVLQYMPLNESLSFTHADCPYSDLKTLFSYLLGRYHIPHFLKKAPLWIAQNYLSRKAGFPIEEVSPEKAILKNKTTPLLLVHGDSDHYVPTHMSINMWKQRNINNQRDIKNPVNTSSQNNSTSLKLKKMAPDSEKPENIFTETRLVLIKKAAHARSLAFNLELYKTELDHFLSRIESR